MKISAKRLIIFVGLNGSGKTEIALNYAWHFIDNKRRLVLVDLDICNPYFTSRQVGELLRRKGIEVVTPPQGLANTDLPFISPRVRGIIKDEGCTVVFDVGGDEQGAIALGQFAADFTKEGYELYLVVNPFRPLTREYRDVSSLKRRIEAAAGLKVTALVSNPHLGEKTDAETIIRGQRVVAETAAALRLPIAFLALREELAGKVEPYLNLPLLPLRLFLRKPWEL